MSTAIPIRFMHRLAMIAAVACLAISCFGPQDETQQAGELVKQANVELKEVKVLYTKNESTRDDLKQALRDQNVAEVKRVSNSVVDLINEGTGHGKKALEKIDEARYMKINDDYAEYLRLKSEAIGKQIDAFENYRRAAMVLRDSYDPKNEENRRMVDKEFDERSDKYSRTMDDAKSLSLQANEIVKSDRQRIKDN